MIRLKGILTEDGTSAKYITYNQDPNTYYTSSYNPNPTPNLFETKMYKIGIIFIDGFIDKLNYKISITQSNTANSFSLKFRFFTYSNAFVFTGEGDRTGEITPNIYVNKGNYLYLELSGYNVGLYNCEFKLHLINSNKQTYLVPINNPDIKIVKTITDKKMTMDIVKADLDNNVEIIYKQPVDDKYNSSQDSSSDIFSITNYIITNIGITGKIKPSAGAYVQLLTTTYNNVPLPCNVTLIINSEFITVDLTNTISSHRYIFPDNIYVSENDNIILQLSGYNAILTETQIILTIIPSIPYNFPKFIPLLGEQTKITLTNKLSQSTTINILQATDNIFDIPNGFGVLYILRFNGPIKETIKESF